MSRQAVLPLDSIEQHLRQAFGSHVIGHNGWLSTARKPKRDQGWKLHVSASLQCAPEVLRRILPILIKEDASFKVAANLGCLSDLNEGLAGISQVGKFITVYPDDEEHAVRLAVELDRATDDLSGPRIPSDRPLRPGSIVHYRFGGFSDLELIDSLGQRLPAIIDPNGDLIPDRRGPSFLPPPWATDPFEQAGVASQLIEPDSPLFAGYLILTVLHQHAKGGVYLALDPSTSPPRTCVIKEARHHVAADPLGTDIRDRLRFQYDLLRTLGPDPALPAVYKLFEIEDNLYLVMEHIEGDSLLTLVTSRLRRGERLASREIETIGVAVASAVDRVHRHGWVLRDLTPTNIIVTADQHVHLIDFELAHAIGDAAPVYGWGTRGYISPQQAKRCSPNVVDDVYGLGATFYFMATAADPSFSIDRPDALRRVITLLNPKITGRVVDVVARCMDPDPMRRPPDMASVIAALRQRSAKALSPPTSPILPLSERCGRFLELAQGIGDRLIATAVRTNDGACWASTAATDTANQPQPGASHLPRTPRYPPYLHTGTAGVILFLVQLAEATDDDRYLAAAQDGGRWLLTQRHAVPDHLPGLHFGAAGIAAVLCRLARVTGTDLFLEVACEISERLLPARTAMPDITHGWAGIGLLHLNLAAATGQQPHLVRARAMGNALVASAEPIGPGHGWRQPPGPHVGMSDDVLTGFAHGAAGIGYFLLELWRATGEARYHDFAVSAARWLMSRAEPCLPDESGCNWPIAERDTDDASRWFFWCHGAAGIGRFFLRAWELTGNDDYRKWAEAASTTVALAGRHGGGAICHGLPGNGSYLLESYHVFRDPIWLESAFDFGEILELYARRDEDGLAWPAEHPNVVTPDYMVGFSGVGAFLLGLARPDHRRQPLDLPAA